MASFVYSSFVDELARNQYTVQGSSFKLMFVTKHYAEDKDHTRRSQVTDEVVGKNYQFRGYPVSLTLQRFGATAAISIAALTLHDTTIKPRGAVIYKSNGGLAADDQLVAYIDFDTDIPLRGDVQLSFPLPLRFEPI